MHIPPPTQSRWIKISVRGVFQKTFMQPFSKYFHWEYILFLDFLLAPLSIKTKSFSAVRFKVELINETEIRLK